MIKKFLDLTGLSRLRNSLSTKMFVTIQMFALILGSAAITFGFYLYRTSTTEQFAAVSTNVASTVEVILNGRVNPYVEELLDEYERENDNLKISSIISDLDFKEMMEMIHEIARDNNATAVYIGAYEPSTGRLIYMLDSDSTETHNEAGTWDIIDEKEAAEYMNIEGGKKYYIGKTEQYGYLCTGWEYMFNYKQFMVMAFVDLDMNQIVKDSIMFLVQYIILLMFVTALLDIAIVTRVRSEVVNPINKLAGSAKGYMKDKYESIESENYFENLNIRTGDEIENLADTMSQMEKDIRGYIANIEKNTSERERIGTELSIASKIQAGMIPHQFPPFPDRNEIDIYALIDPAKAVGGDFYDFFMPDENHLVMVMADVSDKGIPASLFMMASKILLKNIMMLNKMKPSQALYEFNNQICAGNEAEMFVTVWLGIMELTTGMMICANAGHEYPLVRHDDGRYEILKDKHGFVIGGMPNMKYTDYRIQLEPGDSVFLYTDGVTDASNSEGKLYGLERAVEVLNEKPELDMKDTLNHLLVSINDYVGEANQFDDITMMGVRYLGSQKENNEITLEAKISNILKLTSFIDERLVKAGCPPKVRMQIDVAVDEIFSNIAKYAYTYEDGIASIVMEFLENNSGVLIKFIDSGVPFNPLEVADPDLKQNAKDRGVGGLGIYMVKKSMDEVTYKYKKGKNVLTIRKMFGR